MGNKEHRAQDDFQKMVHEMRKDQTKRVNIHPEKVRALPIRNTWP